MSALPALVALFGLLCGDAQALEQLECDFESGMSGWTGDGEITFDASGTNRVYSLKKTGSERPELKCTVTVPKDGHVEIRFRVRGMPGGKGLKLRKATRGPRGAGFVGHVVESTGEWKQRIHGTRDRDGSGPYERTFALVLLEGVGEIQIDDIQVTKAVGFSRVEEGGGVAKADGSPAMAGAPKAVQTTQEKYWPIGAEASILIPAGWAVIHQGLPAPVLLSAEGKQMAVSAIKESPGQVATNRLDEYAKLKAITLQSSFPDFEASQPKSGKIGELPAIFFNGPATIEGVRAEVNAMTIQGREAFYVILGIAPQGSPVSTRTELMRVLRTFREEP